MQHPNNDNTNLVFLYHVLSFWSQSDTEKTNIAEEIYKLAESKLFTKQ